MSEVIIQNPISKIIKRNLQNSPDKVKIIVPFISSFSLDILKNFESNSTKDKRLITRFEDINLNCFNIPVLLSLLEKGFEIRYNNKIHMKLYLIGTTGFVTSSNFTKGGFEDNHELTVQIESSNFAGCNNIFETLWNECKNHKISKELLLSNIDKYNILKKKESFKKSNGIKFIDKSSSTNELNLDLLVDEIFNSGKNYSSILNHSYGANKIRSFIKNELLTKNFSEDILYAGEKHPKRRKNLFYYLSYGDESKIAGTGLREAQFKEAFTNKNFREVIFFVFPEIQKLESWNLNDDQAYYEFCQGLFDFKIPQYVEALPIRIASFFYPDNFIQIFNLKHLEKICSIIGLETNAKTKGDKLYAYNKYLHSKMSSLPYNSYIKSNIAYQILYAYELYNHLKRGKTYKDVLRLYKKKWIRDYIEQGFSILGKINAIK